MSEQSSTFDGSVEQTDTTVEPDGSREYVTTSALGKWTSHVVKRAASEAYHATLSQVARQDAERQAIEDSRANHRNLNRFMTLICALLIGLVITYTLQNNGIPFLGVVYPAWTAGLAPYSFVITVMLDSTLAAYAFIKKY